MDNGYSCSNLDVFLQRLVRSCFKLAQKPTQILSYWDIYYTSIKYCWNHTKYIKIESANPANHLRVQNSGFMFWVQVFHNFGLPSTPIISIFLWISYPPFVRWASAQHQLFFLSIPYHFGLPRLLSHHLRKQKVTADLVLGSTSGSWRDTHKKDRFTRSYRFFPLFLSMLIPSLNHGDMHPNSLIHWMISFINILVNLHSNIIWPHIFHDLFYPSPLNILTCHSLGCSFNPLGARISRAKTFSFAAMDPNPVATALDIYFISHNVS